MTTVNREIEIKLLIEDHVSRIHNRLQATGFQISRTRVFETNVLLDTIERRLRDSAELIRMRRVGHECILTYKGRPDPGKHKSREELETSVASGDKMELILARLGLLPVFRYEKFRTEFQVPGQAGVVTLDETPIGLFIEIEGKPDWIDQVAGSLGFSEEQYITKSYGGLYLDYCRSRGLTPTDMLFEPKGNRE